MMLKVKLKTILLVFPCENWFIIIDIFITKTNVYIEKKITNKCLIENLCKQFFVNLHNPVKHSLLFQRTLRYKPLVMNLLCTLHKLHSYVMVFVHFLSLFQSIYFTRNLTIRFLRLAKRWHQESRNDKCL